jgi:undecaprenyl-diphosphatase
VIFFAGFLVLFGFFWVVFLLAEPPLGHLLKRTAHWTTKFRYRDYLPVIVVLAVGLGASLIAGDLFEDLAELVHDNSPELRDFDARAHQWARFTRTTGATRFFTTMTIIGTPVGLGALLVIVAVLLALRGRWRWIAYLAVTTGVGGLLNVALKAFFARARPELAEALRHASGYSFPSGHAMGSTIVFGALAYLALRILPTWRERAAALAFAVSMIIAIASSRIYLGVHWISDVAAGIVAGLIWVVTTTVAYESFRRIRMIRALRRARQDDARSSALTSRGE